MWLRCQVLGPKMAIFGLKTQKFEEPIRSKRLLKFLVNFRLKSLKFYLKNLRRV